MSSQNALPDFFAALQPRVNDLRLDEINRLLYSTYASIYQVMPTGVMLPRNTEEIQAAVEEAARFRMALLPRGGGSSLAGQTVNEALVIDTTRHLDKILEVNAEESWVRVQPGVVLDTLNAHLKPFGLKFGPDPASSNRAVMGGIISNNATGSHSILYGMSVDHVIEVKGFLSDGSPFHFRPMESALVDQIAAGTGLEAQIYRTIRDTARDKADIIRAGTPRHWRRCGGYNLDRFLTEGVNFHHERDARFNLTNLICGAEGTLGVITELKLRLVPLPKTPGLALLQFDTLREALTSVPAILEVNPSAIELLDNLGLTLCREVPEYARLLKTFISGDPHCILITEFYGESQSELDHQVETLRAHLKKNQINATLVPALDNRVQQNVWTVRKVGLGLLMSIKGDQKPLPFIEDAAVPPQHLAEYIDRLETFCREELQTPITYYAHASAGCLHVRPLINAKVAAEVEKMPLISRFSADLVSGYGGAIASEHGDGRTRGWLSEHFFGKDLSDLYKTVKAAFDPHNILNPGNIVDIQDMTANLRYGPAYRTISREAFLDFSEDQGFERAVELCNGAGVCRKLDSGTMCPSFMATREEEHSTRGRANALRAALSGKLPEGSLTGKRLYEVMDLCIECKGCKAECPSSVDMAKIKFEFLARYYEKNGTPLRVRFFGLVPLLSRLIAGPLAILANAPGKLAPVKFLLEKGLGISAKRSLPAFADQSFNAWYQHNRGAAGINPAQKQVVLFNDTFNTYNDPHISIAALEVLEAAGYEVLLPGHKCCGRPMISKGLVKQARAAARDTVAKLLPFAEAGIPIVGLEPSCLLSFRDEYKYLLPGEKAVGTVAEMSFTFEEFIAGLVEKGELHLDPEKSGRKALLHGHCHQKSLVGTAPSHATLAAAGYAVSEVDSGCCGMAGSFGYEAEHVDISLKIGERRLFPAVRQEDGETIIVAAGTSCRHQIHDGTGRKALHPAEAIRLALKSR